MSRMQTVHVKLERCDKWTTDFHKKHTVDMDEYDLSDYCSSCKVLVKDGVWWEIVHQEDFDEYGFTKVLHKDNSSLELITHFYNGGACLDEIIEACLEDNK